MAKTRSYGLLTSSEVSLRVRDAAIRNTFGLRNRKGPWQHGHEHHMRLPDVHPAQKEACARGYTMTLEEYRRAEGR